MPHRVVRTLGIGERTYYRWRREYGGLRVDQAKRLKDLERANSRLERLVADQAVGVKKPIRSDVGDLAAAKIAISGR